MSKVNTEGRSAPATRLTGSVPAAVRYTSGRALLSAYSPKAGAPADGKGSLAVASGKAAVKDPVPRVWNCNKPKILKNFNVYGKQAPTIKAAKTTVRRWVNPVDSPKTKNRSEGSRNYEALYVSLDDDGRCSDSSNADISQIGRPDVSKTVEAKRKQVHINRCTQLEANQEVLKEDQPPFTKSPCLLPAGERHSLKVETNKEEMAILIAEVMEIRQELGIADEPPLPPPPQIAGEFQPPPLVRSRTWTYFSITDYPHPKLYEYIKHLPHASTPITPIPTQQDDSGTSAEN